MQLVGIEKRMKHINKHINKHILVFILFLIYEKLFLEISEVSIEYF